MKPTRNVFFLLLFQVTLCCTLITAQIGPSTSSNQIQNGVEKQDPVIQAIINKSKEHFEKGKALVEANKRYEAKQEFDAAVDVILKSGIDVRSLPRLQEHYWMLVKNIYDIEVPQASVPSLDNRATVAASYNGKPDSEEVQVGFGKTDFILTGDPLARLRLSENKTTTLDNIDKPCKASPPTIRNLNLGMTSQQVTSALKTKLKLLPMRGDYDGIGITGTRIVLHNTRFVELAFYKNRLCFIYVVYDDTIKWNGISEFTSKISASLNLPKKWIPISYYKQKLICKGFDLTAESLVFYSLTLADTKVLRQIIEDQEQQRKNRMLINEKKKEAFKP